MTKKKTFASCFGDYLKKQKDMYMYSYMKWYCWFTVTELLASVHPTYYLYVPHLRQEKERRGDRQKELNSRFEIGVQAGGISL